MLRVAGSHSLQVSNGGAAGIRALPSFRARGQVQDLAMAAAGSRLRGRSSLDSCSSLDSRSSLDNPARTPTSAMQTSTTHASAIDVTPLGLASTPHAFQHCKALSRICKAFAQSHEKHPCDLWVPSLGARALSRFIMLYHVAWQGLVSAHHLSGLHGDGTA